jgi:hypothetical protein
VVKKRPPRTFPFRDDTGNFRSWKWVIGQRSERSGKRYFDFTNIGDRQRSDRRRIACGTV